MLIYKRSLRMGANYVECNSILRPVIELLTNFNKYDQNKYGGKYFGNINGRYTVGFNYKMPYNKILVAGINKQGIMNEDVAIITVKGL